MKIKLLLVSLFFIGTCYAQKCHTSIIQSGTVDGINLVSQFQNENFAALWLKTDNKLVFGVIGNDNQRLLIKLTSITQNLSNPKEYRVVGKSNVKGNICHFKGKITLKKIVEVFNARLGVDNEYQGEVKRQYLLIADYVFNEDPNEKDAGIFSGKLETKFYVNRDNYIKYNNIDMATDGFFNNGFVGTWKSYLTDKPYPCNWGDYRVPNSDCDFDIGNGKFSVSKKYLANGWATQPKANWWQ